MLSSSGLYGLPVLTRYIKKSVIGVLGSEVSSRHVGSDCLRPIPILFNVKLQVQPGQRLAVKHHLNIKSLIPWFIVSIQTIYCAHARGAAEQDVCLLQSLDARRKYTSVRLDGSRNSSAPNLVQANRPK